MKRPQYLNLVGLALLCLVGAVVPSLGHAARIIDTVVGSGPNNVPALETGIGTPFSQVGVAVDHSGNIYLASFLLHKVLKVNPSGMITTIAGNGLCRFSGDGGPATEAGLCGTQNIVVDAAGNLFIADWGNHRIRKVDPNGLITTIAGNGSDAVCGDGGPASAACVGKPFGLALDATGNLFISESFYHRIRKVDPNGLITTVAGNGTPGFCGDGGPATNACLFNPAAVALDAAGQLFIADETNHRIRKVDLSGLITTVAGNGSDTFCGDGGPATSACLFNPAAVALDAAGQLFIADRNNFRIRKVDPSTGFITTVAGNGTASFCGNGGLATNACLHDPRSIAVDAAGQLFFADLRNQRIRMVDASGIITTIIGNGTENFCGDGWAATGACLNPKDLTVDAAGNLFIADWENQRIRKVDATTGLITTVAGNGTPGFCGDEGPATSACLNPTAVALDAAGQLFIADRNNFRIRKVDATTGLITTVAGNGTFGFCGDEGPATNACLIPRDLTVDAAGNLFIADWANHRVRKVDASTGLITTVAGNGTFGFCGDGGSATSACLKFPWGVAADTIGNLFIADRGDHRIRKVDLSGLITTVAGNGTAGFCGDGGPATSACLSKPAAVALDAAGQLFIADEDNQRIRKVDLSGLITTVAGNGSDNFCGDGGPAPSACLFHPEGVTLDRVGNLFIPSSNRIRKVNVEDTVAPVVTPPAPISVEAVDAWGTPVTDPSIQGFLGSATATDEVDGPLTPTHDAPANFPLGVTTVTFSATDIAGNTGRATSTVTVEDTTAPLLRVPASFPVEATGPSGAEVFYVVTAMDAVDPSPMVHCSPASGATLPLGMTTVNCMASDTAGNINTASFTVTVGDTAPPTIKSLSASPNVLWPPNRKMATVRVSVVVTDVVDPAPTCRLTTVESNEPISGSGYGKTAPDWEIMEALTIKLRAERAGSAGGRFYTMAVECTDASNNSSTDSVMVMVPPKAQSQGKSKDQNDELRE